MAAYIDLGGVRSWYDELGDGSRVLLRGVAARRDAARQGI
jgi:hypothetical protein